MEGAGEGGCAAGKRAKRPTKSVSGTDHVLPGAKTATKRQSPGTGGNSAQRQRKSRDAKAAKAAAATEAVAAVEVVAAASDAALGTAALPSIIGAGVSSDGALGTAALPSIIGAVVSSDAALGTAALPSIIGAGVSSAAMSDAASPPGSGRSSPVRQSGSPISWYVSPETSKWNPKREIRLILAACTEEMKPFLDKLGTTPERLEMNVSSSVAPMLPHDQFFSKLGKTYNDPTFEGIIPWSDDHIDGDYPLQKRREVTYLRASWVTLCGKYEVAFARWSRSGVNDECFCLCGAPGFYTTSGWKKDFQTKENKKTPEPSPGNTHWGPKADKGVYVW